MFAAELQHSPSFDEAPLLRGFVSATPISLALWAAIILVML